MNGVGGGKGEGHLGTAVENYELKLVPDFSRQVSVNSHLSDDQVY